MEFEKRWCLWLKGSPGVEFDKKMVLLTQGLCSSEIRPKDGVFGSTAYQKWHLIKRWCFGLMGSPVVEFDQKMVFSAQGLTSSGI